MLKNIMNTLFGPKSSPKVELLSEVIDLESLIVEISDGGNKENPFHNSLYSLSSRTCAIDYTCWISSKIQKNQFQNVSHLIWELVKYNAGIVMGDDQILKKDWNEKIHNICVNNKFVPSDSSAECDGFLRATLIIQYLHAKNFGTTSLIDERGVEEILGVLSLFGYIKNFSEEEVKKVNSEIRKNKKELAAWEEVKLINYDKLNISTKQIQSELINNKLI